MGSESWVLVGNLDGVSIVFVDLSQQGRGLMKVGLKASRLLHGLLLKLSQFHGEEKGYRKAIYMWSLLKLFSRFIFKNITFLIWIYPLIHIKYRSLCCLERIRTPS